MEVKIAEASTPRNDTYRPADREGICKNLRSIQANRGLPQEKNLKESKGKRNKFQDRLIGKHFKCYKEKRTEKYPLKNIIGKHTSDIRYSISILI